MGTRILLNLKEVAREEERLGIWTSQMQSAIEFGPAEIQASAAENAMDDESSWRVADRFSDCEGRCDGVEWIAMEEPTNEP